MQTMVTAAMGQLMFVSRTVCAKAGIDYSHVSKPKTVAKEESSTNSDDLQEKRRLFGLIRTLYLFYYASTGSLVPYLPVYYHSMGFGGEVIGSLSALRPFVNFLVAPLWGAIADYSQDTLNVLNVAAVGSVMGYVAIGLQREVTPLVVAVFVTSIFYAPVKSLMDSMVLEQLAAISSSSNKTEKKDEFGKLRLFGPLGFGLGCSIAGVVVTRQHRLRVESGSEAIIAETSHSFGLSSIIEAVSSRINSANGYQLLFIIFALMSVPMLLTLACFPRKLESTKTDEHKLNANPGKPTNGTTRLALIRDGLGSLPKDSLVFFFLVFVLGVNYGAVETFCYVRMREVGATGQQIGFSRLLSAIAGTPMFWFSGKLTTWVSGRSDANADEVMILSLMGFAIRFLVYALIRSPMDALPAEAIRGITFAAFYNTASTYIHRIAPKGYKSTMLMIMNTLYGGLGQSIGSMLAGRIQAELGTGQMFLVILGWDMAFLAWVLLWKVCSSRRKD